MKIVLTVLAVCMISYSATAAWNSIFVPDEHTRGLWHFDGTAGDTNTPDASTNGNTAYLYNPNSSGNQLDSNKTWTTSMPGFGNCLKTWWISSSDNNRGALYVSQATNDTLRIKTTEDLTIEFWLKPQYVSYPRDILRHYTGGNYYVRLNYDKIELGWYVPGKGWKSVNDTTSLLADEWTHVAITMDRTSNPASCDVAFWINGSFSSETNTGWAANSGTAGWEVNIIAARDAGNPYYGYFDELRISDILRYPEAKHGTVIIVK